MQSSPLGRLVSALILALFGGVFGLFMLGLGGMELWRARRLEERSVTTSARAFDWSTVTGDGPTSYELHYDFVVDGVTYSGTDATGREGLWQEVPYEAWQRSQETGLLEVRYVPCDPWNNGPAAGSPGSMGDHLAGLVLGAVCCLGSLVLPFFALFGRRR